ncbi:MAG: DUF4405 domain-containing protein [Salinivirgaceae bacterium]|nr:DUF4405 domain-containing protein [Salinivirgaceae bacterium]
MKHAGTKLLNLRAFVILTATVSGLGLPITGLANHLHQMDPIVSFSRHAWMAAHWILGILFTMSTVSHAILNRRMLHNYIRGHAAHPGVGREAVGAIILVALMLFFAVGHAFH